MASRLNPQSATYVLIYQGAQNFLPLNLVQLKIGEIRQNAL